MLCKAGVVERYTHSVFVFFPRILFQNDWLVGRREKNRFYRAYLKPTPKVETVEKLRLPRSPAAKVDSGFA